MSELSEVPETGPIDNSYLSDQFMDMVFYIERYHSTMGEAPTDENLNRRFGVEQPTIEEFKIHPLVQKSLKHRGIVYPRYEDRLNDRQMAAVAAMLNYTDKRSDEKKLRDIGITTREWHGWLLDDAFAGYVRDRSEKLLANSQHEAHLGLIKGIRTGNIAHVKLYNEMTGRYNPEAESNFNVRLLLGKFIEILQKHIQDPAVLNVIAMEITNAAAREQMGNPVGGPSGRFAPQQKMITMKGDVI